MRTKHREASDAVADVERKIRDLEQKTSTDYGPDGRWLHLQGECIEFKPGGEFSYEMCPFGEAKQKDSRGIGTSVGKWDGFGRLGEEEGAAGGAERYKTMRFSNGQHCWNGPARSLVVSVSCGPENKILGVEEPEVCKYSMRFETPAACTEAHRAEAQADLDLLSAAPKKDEL